MKECEVGTAEFTRDLDEEVQDHDLYAQVSVNGGSHVLHTTSTKTNQWDQDLVMWVDQLCSAASIA